MRKSGSIVRDRIVKILNVVGISYGYEIFKVYKEVYGEVLLRSIYYNLNKGAQEGIFSVMNAENILGDFTWGSETERIYYRPVAKFDVDEKSAGRIKRVFSSERKRMSDEIKALVSKIEKDMKCMNTEKDRIKLVNRCEKLKRFYILHFDKYPKVLDKWLETLTP